MLDSLHFSDAIVKTFLQESFIYLYKYFAPEEQESFFDDLGVNLGMLALKFSYGSDPGMAEHEEYESILSRLIVILGDQVSVKLNEDNTISLTYTPKVKDEFIGESFLRAFFYRALSGATATRFYGDVKSYAIGHADGQVDVIVYPLASTATPKDGAIAIKTEDLPVRENTITQFIFAKIAFLMKKARQLEMALDKCNDACEVKDGEDESELLKYSQELEIANIELKSQNALLTDKNTELAFRLIDLEDELKTAKLSVNKFTKESIEEVAKNDEHEEQLNKRISELEAKLRQTEIYLDLSTKDLQNKLMELENLKKENNSYYLAKEAVETENIMLKKQLQYKDDILNNLELEKDGLATQVSELEKLNAQLQNSYINKKSTINDSETGVGDGEFYNKIHTILNEFIPESSKVVLDKAMDRVSISKEKLENSLESKGVVVAAIVKLAPIIVSDKDAAKVMIENLNALL